MKDLSTVDYFDPMEKIVNVLMQKTQNNNPLFFRLLVSYYFCKISSMMRVNINTKDRGIIPVGMYVINLAHCVDKDTEFLTPTGWKKISEYREGDKVLEIDPYNNFEAKFKKPLSYINEKTNKKVYKVTPTKNSKVSMIVSENHGIFYSQKTGSGNTRYYNKPAKDFFKAGIISRKLHSNFNLVKKTKVNLTDTEIKLMVSFIADGYITKKNKYKGRIRVSKKRKILRLRKILKKSNIPYREQKEEKDNISFFFNPPILTKDFNWAWKANKEQLKIISDESIYWDGSIDKRTGNYRFYTSIKKSADFMQYAYQSTFDKVISINVTDRRGRVRNINNKNYMTNSIEYTVYQTSSKSKSVNLDNVTKVSMPNGRQYCFTTSTGYWLMRKDNYISLTHNSGFGKGMSTNYIEEHVIDEFREKFLEETFMEVSNKNLALLATKRAVKYDLDEETALDKIQKEFESLGQLAFSFDSATPAAVKQMRTKLLMANCGSVNFEMDEIGSNLMGNIDVLATFLELYDVGKVKQKLTKNTAENKRSEEIPGRTPTNMMLFGTPDKLLDGGKTEAEFTTMNETGYARRCFFGFENNLIARTKLTPDQIYDMMTDKNSSDYIKKISRKLGKLADIVNFGITLDMTKDVTLKLIEYKIYCENLSDKLKNHQGIMRAEVSHRYYKALKLAGAYAFIDGKHEITKDHLYAAIKLTEDSGNAFRQVLTRERNYVKLAKYLADTNSEVTKVDLIEELAFYRGGDASRKEMMDLASAYGYKNNIIIKTTYVDGIEFFKGESMEVTDLDNMIISYSKDVVKSYRPEKVTFNQIKKVISANGFNYTNHHFKEEYRHSDNAIKGFNMIMLDIDGGVSLDSAQLLLQGFKAIFITTKRHTDDKNRFRIILPLSHTVKLGKEAFSKFMGNIFNWLPFDSDSQTKDIARKWISHNGNCIYQEGKLVDVMLFIPQTQKQKKHHRKIMDNQGLSNLERWFSLHTNEGNRSNNLIRYALTLVDNNLDLESVSGKVLAFNNKLSDSLSEDEVNRTILITVAKAIAKRDN